MPDIQSGLPPLGGEDFNEPILPKREGVDEPFKPSVPSLGERIDPKELEKSLDKMLRRREGKTLKKLHSFKEKGKLFFYQAKWTFKYIKDEELDERAETELTNVVKALKEQIVREMNAPEGEKDDMRLGSLLKIFESYLIAEGVDIKEGSESVIFLRFAEKLNEFLSVDVEDFMKQWEARSLF